VTPFFRLSTPMTRAWAVNREARHKLARWLAHQFAKTGVAVCTDTLSVVAWVNPLAQVKFATPPFQKVERHQCVNNPSWSDCECRRWFDPESGGAWGKRETAAHHPLCIFDEKALGRWREVELPAKVREQAVRGGFLADSVATAEWTCPGHSA
jgi:hypothetical protein